MAGMVADPAEVGDAATRDDILGAQGGRPVRASAGLLGLVLASFWSLEAGAETVVTKAQWVEGMKTGLPVAFCKEGSYFRACFRVSAEQCEDTALSTTRVCLANVEDDLPAVFHQPLDGQKWGQKVGSCAGSTYETTHKAERIASERCKDITRWK
jgi:hypothetical protein